MTTYVIAMHNNSVILLALGLPFDRSLPWHKLLAASSIFNSLVHALAFYLNGRNDTMPDADKSHHIMKMNKVRRAVRGGVRSDNLSWSECSIARDSLGPVW